MEYTEFNHALIQLYRDGEDCITEHSDKTLDIVRGSLICNVSLGAQRTMVMRSKASDKSTDEANHGRRRTQRVPLPDRSLFILGAKTNMRWLHGIRPDRRPSLEKSAEERAYSGARISLTFRHIGTFTDPVAATIWGQGACSITRDKAGKIIHVDAFETERLIRAFREENHATDLDWDAVYGKGSDVVNFVKASTAKLVTGGDSTVDLCIILCLEESGQRYDLTDSIPWENFEDDGRRPLYANADAEQVIAGDIDIVTHLARNSLPIGTRLSSGQTLLKEWRSYQAAGMRGVQSEFNSVLGRWEQVLGHRSYLNGSTFALDDCCFWPVLREIERETAHFSTGTSNPNLQRYYNRVGNRKCVKAVLEHMER